MFFISKFLTNIQNQKIKKLEDNADDVLELSNDLKAIRINKEILIVDSKRNKIIKQMQDTFPSTPARAVYEIGKDLKLFEENKKASKDIWTCNFRENEQRWVWYQNLAPKITVSFKEVYPENSLEDKFYFYSARFGSNIIDQIKEQGLNKTAKNIKALILENSFIKTQCKECQFTDNYTIDDLVDENKKATYDGHFIVCSNCGSLIKLS